MRENGQHHTRAERPACPPDAADLAEFGLAGDDDTWLERVGTAEAATLATIGSFRLIDEVGTGGQGVVYRAIDERTGRRVAIKHLHAGSFATTSARHRFEREIEAAAALNHPGIVTLFSREQADGLSVISMEWVDGVPVTAWASPRGVPQVLALFVRICDAVAHAHQRGVIHRDLKPSNVLVDAGGAPHIVDFGIAKVESGAECATLTRSGQFVGTPAYASPEQISGKPEDVDTRSDVYAIGVMLYEALTGCMPYPVEGPLADVFDAIRVSDPVRPSSVRRGLDHEIDSILLKTLRKEPGARYESVAELGRELERYLNGEPVEARGHDALYRLGKAVRRHRGLVAVGAFAAILALGYAVVMPMLYRQAADEAHRAREVQHFLERTLTSASPYQRDGELTLAHLLEEAARRVQRDLADQPGVAADIHKTIARTYAGLWLWPRAEEHAQKAIDIYRTHHGPGHPEVARCLNLLARAQAFREDPRCIATVREAVTLRRELYGDAHPDIAESLSTSGFALWKIHQLEKADETESLYRQALDMYGRTLDAPTVPWARSHYSFGSFLRARRRVDDAISHLGRSVEMYRSLDDGDQHFYLARVLGAYARCHLDRGDVDAAESALLDAVELHPPGYVDWSTVDLQWSLGEVARRRGDPAAALARYHAMLTAACDTVARTAPSWDNEWSRLATTFRGSAPAAGDYVDAFRGIIERNAHGSAAMQRRVPVVAAVLAATGHPDAALRLRALAPEHAP